MKKFLLLLFSSISIGFTANAQYVNIPDSNFRNSLRNIHPACFNAAGQMDTTCNEIVNEDSLNVYNIGINDLSGLEYFKNLIYLDCKNNRLNSLPTLPESLTYLNCNYSELTSLPVLPINLKMLYCWGNQLSSLPALPQGLEELSCFDNQLSSLPTLPPGLTKLECYSNRLSSLPTLPQNLVHLDCSLNPIGSLPTLPGNLTYLVCYLNQLSSLPTLPQNLSWLSCNDNILSSLPALPMTVRHLVCRNNQLISLPALPTSLQQFDCSDNQLNSLPPLPGNLTQLFCRSNQLSLLPTLPLSLNGLYCSSNPLRSLPILPQNLTGLECSNCKLSLLPVLPSTLRELMCNGNPDLYCLPLLPGSLFRLDIGNQIMCIPNRPLSLGNISIYDTTGNYVNNPIPICNPLNNSNNCQVYPLMQGSVFYDNNNNGIRDADEPSRKNIKLSISNDRFTFTNNDGLYQIGADSLGAYTLTVNPTRYFDAIPTSGNYNFTSYDTLITKDFALQANTTIDELNIRITPFNWAARPGFSFPYLISYENTGTTTISPNIVFDYDQAGLNYDTSSVAGVTDNADKLAYNADSLAPGKSGSFIGYFTLKTTVPIGDTLNAKAIISANGFTGYDSVQTTVRGAYDPNDKQATPQLSPSQVANGKYIDYTIRFQNTGTDTAFNIVVSDTLSEDLQAGTLEMLVASHSCKATVKDNIVFFEFLNILLPDSNVNESKSHGFVSFRIKPQNNIAENTIIPNKAAIYFDYNSPVMTNTATTEIKTPLVPVPLKLLLFTVVRQIENTAIVSWNTSNEITVEKFYIEQSFDGMNFATIGNEIANGKQYNIYSKQVNIPALEILYFRLKMIDIDGRFTYSPVVTLRKNKMAEPFSILNNPVKDQLNIAVHEVGLRNTFASVINAQGIVLQRKWLQNNIEIIDISRLPVGIYYLNTEKGNKQFVIIK